MAVIIANDFDESLLKYKRKPGLHYLVERRDGELTLQRVDYALPWSVRLARESALAMHLALNLNVTQRLGALVGNRGHRAAATDGIVVSG